MYTGNIRKSKTNFGSSSVYPCVYREHNIPKFRQVKSLGLSLCIQGTLAVRRFPHQHRQVYPCVYREHIIIIQQTPPDLGLSLCIQGTYFGGHYYEYYGRFIPVYTGNMPSRSPNCHRSPVYPCVYREHIV